MIRKVRLSPPALRSAAGCGAAFLGTVIDEDY
jgi:hypothetical protein